MTGQRELNYRPNSVARGLVTRRTATIGLIIAEIDAPIFLQAVRCVEPLARAAGYNVLVSHASTLDDEQQALELLREKQVEGGIFFSVSEYRSDEHWLTTNAAGLPIVLINRAATHAALDQINWDNAGGVTAAVQHLATLGHRHIAHLHGPRNRHSSEERLRGYAAGLAACGLPYREAYVRGGDYTADPAQWRQSTLELLALTPRPTAIIAAADMVAAIAMKTAQQAGLLVPAEMSIVGIDNEPYGSYLNPALTTVELPVVAASKLALTLLLKRINDRECLPQQLSIACPLVMRESTAPVPT